MHFPQIIDSSMLAMFKACPQKFFLEYCQDWKPKQPSVHLHAGGAFAHALKVTRRAYYEGMVEYMSKEITGFDENNLPIHQSRWVTIEAPEVKDNSDDAVAYGLQALINYYGDFQCPADSPKSLERMCGAFEYYWENYPLGYGEGEPILTANNKRAIEFSFAEPLEILHPVTGEPIIYCGRADCIMHRAGGIWICDEKTTQQMGAAWASQWDLRSQFSGYAWAAHRSGIRVDGALVRGIAIYKTKFETQEIPSYRPEWRIERWEANTISWIQRMIDCYHRGVWQYNEDSECTSYGGCQFKQVCSSPDPQPWLETYFEKRRWNPISHSEEKV
jgi:hypothetical protein